MLIAIQTICFRCNKIIHTFFQPFFILYFTIFFHFFIVQYSISTSHKHLYIASLTLTLTISCVTIILYLSFCVIPYRESGPFFQNTRKFMLEIRVIRIAVLCGHLMALFLFMGNLGYRFPILLFIFIILKP